MDITINLESSVPVYLQIVDRIKYLVTLGQLQPGEQLPTIRQLAADLRINFNTVARAYTELDRAGVISTEQGRGTFVARRPDDAHLTRVRQERLDLIFSQAFADVLALGYQREEIEQAIERQMAKWRREGLAL